jgi:quercetin dioxygenase-like cupin family protein
MFSLENSNNMIAAVVQNDVDMRDWVQTPLSNFLITSEDTQGKAALMEAVQVKGNEPPRHSHPETDETFYVINGKITFFIAGETISAPAGTTVFIERGKEYSFTVETETANTLILLTPAVNEKAQVRA